MDRIRDFLPAIIDDMEAKFLAIPRPKTQTKHARAHFKKMRVFAQAPREG